MELDVVIPLYNEEENIKVLYQELVKTLEGIKYNLIFVDDGSIDKSLEEITKLYKEDKKHIKVISFSRNFGKDAAIFAGMEVSKAKYTAIIDADMQQQPKYIVEMLNFLKEHIEYDEVAMVNDYGNDSSFQKSFKNIFYGIMQEATGQKYVAGASDFRLLRKDVVRAIVSMRESNRFTKGLFSWVGFKTYYMKYKPDRRYAGVSKFKFRKQVAYAMDGIINFSVAPLKFIIWLGLIIAFGSFIYLILLIIKTLYLGIDVPGYASLMSVILLLGGLILFVLGIIGEYVSKTYIEIKRRPIYVSKLTLGLEE